MRINRVVFVAIVVASLPFAKVDPRARDCLHRGEVKPRGVFAISASLFSHAALARRSSPRCRSRVTGGVATRLLRDVRLFVFAAFVEKSRQLKLRRLPIAKRVRVERLAGESVNESRECVGVRVRGDFTTSDTRNIDTHVQCLCEIAKTHSATRSRHRESCFPVRRSRVDRSSLSPDRPSILRLCVTGRYARSVRIVLTLGLHDNSTRARCNNGLGRA